MPPHRLPFQKMTTRVDHGNSRPPARLIIVGSGHLAWQMGEALVDHGAKCVGVWSRKPTSAHSLATRLFTAPLGDDPERWPEADFVLLAVSDAAISECAERIAVRPDQIILHASGSGHLNQLSPHKRCGIIWPLATLRRERGVEWQATPLFVEGSDPEATNQIVELARSISHVVIQTNATLRQAYHVAAVGSANFSLFLLAETSEWLKSKGGDPRLLGPILQQVWIDFMEASNLHDRQTGPASRGDRETVDRQQTEVSEQPALSALYRLFSDLIGLKHASSKQKQKT
jgi:predicted short-subunit dehydrogenase-like oxidoreductase (DUF2520 family)